ncbi:MAG: T9SS type A sorting domain-containing protein [Flavobacteriales bacterium]|nr:T9SS type A sorting domain-containing protein [Flavobacteriales bacterium]
MPRTQTAILSALLVTAAHAQTITSVQFNPNSFSECELVELTVHGTLPGNATINSFVPGQVGNTITVELVATGSGGGTANFNQGIPPLGPFPAGNYVFQVSLNLNGNVTATNNTNKTVTPGVDPDAGEYGENTQVCLVGSPINMFTLLGGAPDSGGDWFDPFGNPHPANFVPGVDQEGFYTYSIEVLPPCNSAAQNVLMLYATSNDPGTNGFAQVCVGGDPVDLFQYLGGRRNINKKWTRAGNPHSNIFDPSVDPAGVYTYTVPAIAPCPAPFATVTVTIQQPPSAGSDGAVTVCSTDTSYALADGLGGNPAQTGTWYDPQGFTMGNYSASMIPSVNGPGVYTYVVTSAICPSDTASLTIVVIDPPCNIGIEEPGAGLTRFELVPNPTDGLVTLEAESRGRSQDLRVQVSDLSGKVLLTLGPGRGDGHQLREQLDLRHLPSGVYAVHLSTADGSVTRRLVLR